MNGSTNNGIKTRILAIPSVVGIEPTYLTETTGKWLVIVKEAQKDQSRRAIDIVINEKLFPESQTERPERSNRHKINASLVAYAAALEKESPTSTIQFLRPPQNAYKRHIRASYDIDNETSFPDINNKKKKHSNTTITDSNDTSATASITPYESTIMLTFSHDDLLEKNNNTFEEEIEASFMQEVAAQLQTHNESMMKKINQKFASFQTVMLQTMKEIVINLIPQITNQQRSTLLSPSPPEMLTTQPSNYPHHGALLTNPYPPQFTMPTPLNQIPPPTLHTNTPPIYIQPQSIQGMTPPTTNTLSPTLPKTQISLQFKLPQSQTSFENAMNAIDADL